MAWRQFLWKNTNLFSNSSLPLSANFSSKFGPYIENAGIPEFLNGIGKGVENHIEKLQAEIGDFQKLLDIRTFKLKKLGIPCKDRKLILRYTNQYKLGLWRPKVKPVKKS